jgi:hypothetical protein
MLGGFIWAARFLIPKAARSGDAMAIACAMLIAGMTLLLWLLVGVAMRSTT